MSVQLPDGRSVGLSGYGDPTGAPMFLFHGTPGSSEYLGLVDEPSRAHGVNVLAPDRPGMGRSDPHPLPSAAAYVDDVAAIADSLGLSRFPVAGHSGGGPFALACGALLGDRVTSVATIAGGAPLDTPAVRDSLPPDDARVLRLLEEGKEGSIRRQLRVLGFLQRYLPWLAQAVFRRQVDPSDVPLLDRTTIKGFAAGLAQGPDGAMADYRILATKRGWGFEPADIAVPVHIWQGEEDRMALPIQAHTLSEMMPQAELHLIPGAGHLAIFAHFGEILDALGTPNKP